jgi:hypothetical protein
VQTAREIYDHYQVPPWLQAHQVRVAAVGKMVAAHIPEADAHLVISTCLLHDIGAIVKFDFDYMRREMPQLAMHDDLSHWERVQEDIRARYGEREHQASAAMLQELGFNDVRAVFEMIGLAKVPVLLASDRLEPQIVQYADMRVGPFGIIPLEERLSEGERRYAEYIRREGKEEESKLYPVHAAMLERQLFEGVRFRPEDITDEAATPLMEELWDYEIA